MQCFERAFLQLRIGNRLFRKNPAYRRYYSSERIPENASENEVTNPETGEEKLSGFAKAFEKHETLLSEREKKPVDNRTFAALLRHSKFVDLGDPEGKIVTGKIFHVVGSDLYIDFGWKFHCICSKPLKNSDGYIRGAVVRLKIKDLELSSRFLGAKTDLTLLEADCTLLGLISTPFGSQKAYKEGKDLKVAEKVFKDISSIFS